MFKSHIFRLLPDENCKRQCNKKTHLGTLFFITVYASNTLIIEKSLISNYMMSHLAIRLRKTVVVLLVFTCAVCN